MLKEKKNLNVTRSTHKIYIFYKVFIMTKNTYFTKKKGDKEQIEW